ncbi:MAG: hypothetical protein E5Y32_17900 [Mesorhizobium sp.]|nr:MAG: hypothetical protein E5Y32_17900 [Mesorhizobium sp.]
MAAGPAFRDANWERISPMFSRCGNSHSRAWFDCHILVCNIQARRLVFKQAKGKGTVMKFLAPVTKLAAGFRKFVARRYRPELYYMRGPGPATARRMGTPRRNQPIDHYA